MGLTFLTISLDFIQFNEQFFTTVFQNCASTDLEIPFELPNGIRKFCRSLH